MKDAAVRRRVTHRRRSIIGVAREHGGRRVGGMLDGIDDAARMFGSRRIAIRRFHATVVGHISDIAITIIYYIGRCFDR